MTQITSETGTHVRSNGFYSIAVVGIRLATKGVTCLEMLLQYTQELSDGAKQREQARQRSLLDSKPEFELPTVHIDDMTDSATILSKVVMALIQAGCADVAEELQQHAAHILQERNTDIIALCDEYAYLEDATSSTGTSQESY